MIADQNNGPSAFQAVLTGILYVDLENKKIASTQVIGVWP
jgi:hypothetical protein